MTPPTSAMPPRPFINDALWRCLCPRFTQVSPHHGSSTVIKVATATGNLTLRCTASPRASSQQLRAYNMPTRANNTLRSNTKQIPHLKGEVPLFHLTTPELYDRLRIDGAAGKFDEVVRALNILIKDRKEIPNTAMYTAFLHSFVNCEKDGGMAIHRVLEEMADNDVELDSRGAECALEVLAVHPDYMLRTDILEYMKERWFDLSDRGHNFVVAGMLRDRCFEQALERLEEMVRQHIKIEAWLWDKTIWMLLEFGEVEEAFYVLSLRQNLDGPEVKLSQAMWLQLLDAAGKKHVTDAVSMIWNTQVVPGYIKPPTGTCLNALAIAARTGNVKLGTDVFRVLAERDTILTSHHYEALIQCYLTAEDLNSAISIILIMQESGIRITPEALHPLYTYLSRQKTRPMEAFKLLQKLSFSGRRIPLVAANTCIQACISPTVANLSDAIEIYKALHTVCKTGPNTLTFNILLQGCSRNKRKELAMFLVSEMVQIGIKPDNITYDRLILVCLSVKDVNDALLYYEEMRNMGWMLRPGTFEALITESVAADDSRAVALVNDYKEKGGAGAKLAQFERLVQTKFELNGAGDSTVAGEGEVASAHLNAMA